MAQVDACRWAVCINGIGDSPMKPETTSDWTAYGPPPEVIPNNDLKPHTFGMACGCKPFDDEGTIVHNSFDGREIFERGERKTS